MTYLEDPQASWGDEERLNISISIYMYTGFKVDGATPKKRWVRRHATPVHGNLCHLLYRWCKCMLTIYYILLFSRHGFEERFWRGSQRWSRFCFRPCLVTNRKLKMNFWKMRFVSETVIFKFRVFHQQMPLQRTGRAVTCRLAATLWEGHSADHAQRFSVERSINVNQLVKKKYIYIYFLYISIYIYIRSFFMFPSFVAARTILALELSWGDLLL